MIKMINYMFWAEQVGVDPPRVKVPFTVRHESLRCKFAKILKRRAVSCGVNPEIRGPQKKEKRKKKNQVLINKIGGLSNGLFMVSNTDDWLHSHLEFQV